MDEYSTRQLGALTATAMAAPVVLVCAACPWRWVLAAVAVAALFYIYIVWALRGTSPRRGYGQLLTDAWGHAMGRVLLGLYGLWIVLAAARAARLAAAAFPLGDGFPVISLALLLLAAWVAGKSTAAVCRFGSVLFFFVLPLLAVVLCFAAADVQSGNLRPAGTGRDALPPLALLVLPGMGLLLRRETVGKQRYGRWLLLTAGLAVACAAVTGGVLGPALAARQPQPFYYLAQSVRIFGVMERFEAVVSALLLTSFACLCAYFFALSGKIAAQLADQPPHWAHSWLPAAAAGALLWVVPLVPPGVFLVGDSLFWGFLPVVTLGVVHVKKK